MVTGEGQITVRGNLNFDTVPALMKEAESLLYKVKQARLSFAEVTGGNSAGLAFILELKRYMQLQNKAIVFADLPEQILTMASAYDIDVELNEYLGLKEETTA